MFKKLSFVFLSLFAAQTSFSKGYICQFPFPSKVKQEFLFIPQTELKTASIFTRVFTTENPNWYSIVGNQITASINTNVLEISYSLNKIDWTSEDNKNLCYKRNVGYNWVFNLSESGNVTGSELRSGLLWEKNPNLKDCAPPPQIGAPISINRTSCRAF